MHPVSLATVDIQSASHSTTAEWLWCAALLVIPFAVTAAVFVLGDSRRRGVLGLIDRPATGLQAATGRPAWSSAGVEIGLWALITAATGFFWDVAWHIDLGRDQNLLTPPHTLIVAGLLGLAAAGAVSIVLASVRRAEVGLRAGPLRIPWGGAGLLVLGTFATIGFPLDALWHATYGVDVTMWSPTHLTMIGGAAFSPIAVWLLYAEGGPQTGRPWARRAAGPMLVGALVVALAAFQLEFDDGVPQWQMLYQPVFVMLGATIALTAARVALGRGWAIWAAVIFIAVRTELTLVVGAALHHVVSHFPLYIGIAVCIELGFLIGRARSLLAQALTAGVIAGTAGLATEWGWSHTWSYQPWQTRMLPALWTAVVAGVAGSVIGAAMGGVLSGERLRIAGRAVGLAAVAALVALAVPFPRHSAPISATVNARAATPVRPTVDRYGRASVTQDVLVDARLAPADAADDADVIRVVAWQGGGRVVAPLHQSAPGTWTTEEAVPVGGSWKTIVLMLKGDVLVASPVAMPADPEYGQAAIPLAHDRTAPMVPASSLLMRESHGGTLFPQLLAYGTFALQLLVASVVLVAGYVSVGRLSRDAVGRRTRPVRPVSAAAVR